MQIKPQAAKKAVLRGFLAWGRQTRVFSRLGLKASEFARQQLDIFGVGQDLPTLIIYGAAYHLPPSSLPVAEATDAPA